MGLRRLKMVILVTVPLLLMVLVFSTLRQANGGVTAGGEHPAQTEPAIPSDPPRADRISFGPLDGLGEAEVSGAPGAVLPSAHVLLINLNTTHQDYVLAEPDGSFSAKIFAPPGSHIMVKHGPDHRFWTNTAQGAVEPGYSIFPSTTIYRPFTHGGGPGALPFAAVGAMDIIDTLNSSVGAAWAMTGTVSNVGNLRPGDTIDVDATVRLYSHAISETTDVTTITLQMADSASWLMLYGEDGSPLPFMNQAGSNRLTPTGYPILDSTRPEVRGGITRQPVSWQYKGGHVVEGALSLEMTVAEEAPPGLYRPILDLQFSGVPSGSQWRAALVSWLAGLPHFAFNSSSVALPPLVVHAPPAATGAESHVGEVRRLIWYLQMDRATLGTRGAGAFQDREIFQPSSFVVTQGAPYVLPPVDMLSGEPATYRLEPFLPMISYGRGPAPGPPMLPFVLPGGTLCVTVHGPDGEPNDLGCEPFSQSRSVSRSTAGGEPLNFGSIEVTEYYGLTTASDRFAVSFTQPGYHLVEMAGWVDDVWGNRYEGGGSYEIWVAHPLDFDSGLLPGTPLAVGDPINPTLQFYPRVPAHVNLTISHFPFSDPQMMQTFTVEGWANRFGTFAPDGPPPTLDAPGEYRLDLHAEYIDPESGAYHVASATWGGVVMTPPAQAALVGHGRRGSDNLSGIPNQWFLFCDENLDPPIAAGGTPHLLNPYLNGDILWSYDQFVDDNPGCLGDALMLNSSIQDTAGEVEAAILTRYERNPFPTAYPGTFEERVQVDALPLFSSTQSGRPPSLFPAEIDQIAYAYLSSQRPGVRVRETVSEERQGSGYWRVNSMYDNQPGVGVEGDLPNDYKFQYVGAVYRDLESGFSEYLGQGSGWIHLPFSDTVGSRVMPPFAGPGNGGWPTDGGPLMTLKGKDIHLFIQPTGVRPGAVMQVGERFHFGGHIMPTLDSRVEAEVTAPSGHTRLVSGRANPVGYFFAPADSFTLDEPGLWKVSVRAWHDGRIGSGALVDCDPADPFDPLRPCPSGDVLGSANGSYAFYVVPPGSPRLELAAPAPGRLLFGEEVSPIEIAGPLPDGVANVTVDYTIGMAGFILEDGQAQIGDGNFTLTFDPKALHEEFPNLDLTGRHGKAPGLADTFSIGLLLSGEQAGEPYFSATTLTIQGDQVYVERGDDVEIIYVVNLPLLRRP